ncbi:MAG: Omp28-related outer membrane protein [bacterium]
MKIYLRLLFPFYLIILILLSGCETSPPVEQNYSETTSEIIINSYPSGAEIFIDGLTTGFFTPDTLEIKNGNHVIKIVRDGYLDSITELNIEENKKYIVNVILQTAEQTKIVLIEDFANVSCSPCVFSNLIVKSLSQYTYGHSKVVAISYHANFPSVNDPFYLANSSEISNALNFYNIYYVPSTFIDGRVTSNSLDSISMKAVINTNLQKVSSFNIDVSKTINNDSLFIHVEVHKLNQSIVQFNNLSLKIAVVESEIEFLTPPGNNLETKFYDVMRLMIPNFTGSTLSELTDIADLNFNFTVYIKPEWQKDKLQVISFIQNTQTKEVLQTNSTF